MLCCRITDICNVSQQKVESLLGGCHQTLIKQKFCGRLVFDMQHICQDNILFIWIRRVKGMVNCDDDDDYLDGDGDHENNRG